MFSSRKVSVLGGSKFKDEFSLSFDGTNDYVDTNADGTLADATYVFWCKSTETGQNKGVFGHGGLQKGAFHFNYNASRPLIYLNSTHSQYFSDNSAQDDGQWHMWAVVIDADDHSGHQVYVDGVLLSKSTGNGSGSITAYGDLIIGAESTSGNAFIGSMSEFCWYNKILTESEIQTLYNGREAYNHLEGVCSANLKGWWRMGDGTENNSGTTIYDMSSESNDATMTNMAADDFTGDTP